MSEEHLKFVTVGHVDHGKSTLIGRLLYETGFFPEAKYKLIQQICEAQGKPFEYAFLLDAFEEEQKQGVTIDVGHIKFKSKKRTYSIIDAPGHKEFLKNMISGAASAEAAVLLIDANEGIQEQTKRHSHLLSLLRIKHIIVVINKMDLVSYDKKRYEELRKNLSLILDKLNLKPIGYVPICAKEGDNVVKKSKKMAWYKEPTFLEYLDGLDIPNKVENMSLRFPVQDVYKIGNKRIIAGKIESGNLSAGDKIVFSPSNKSTTVKSIESWNSKNKKNAYEGESIGITLTDPLYLERGEICSSEKDPPYISDRFLATIFWMGKNELKKSMPIVLKLVTQEVRANLIGISSVMDSDTLEYSLDKESISQNDVAKVSFKCDPQIAFDMFSKVPRLGRFVIVYNDQICGGGIINEGRYPNKGLFSSEKIKSKNIRWEEGQISIEEREKLNLHKSAILWFTGLSGSGKSTIARRLEAEIHNRRLHSFVLDGDNIRHGLNADLGFSPKDREENIRRLGEVAKLFCDAGFVIITSFISPYKQDREMVRKLARNKFIEVFLDCPLEECQKRDPKGLYKKALAGKIKEFTGISAPYEEPQNPDIRIDTSILSAEESVKKIISYLEANQII